MKKYTIFQYGFFYLVLYGFQAITPAISTLLVLIILYGKALTKQFLKKCFIDNIRIRYLVLAFLFPFIIFILTDIFCFVFLNVSTINPSISIKKFIIVLWALISEEIGWRGFLQEKIDEYLNIYITPLVIGVIWALWHYHFFLLGSMSVPFLFFVLGCIADSYGYYWLTKKSKGNIIPASIWHFSGNLFFIIFFIHPEYNHGNILPYVILIILSIIIAIFITIWGIFSVKY